MMARYYGVTVVIVAAHNVTTAQITTRSVVMMRLTMSTLRGLSNGHAEIAWTIIRREYEISIRINDDYV